MPLDGCAKGKDCPMSPDQVNMIEEERKGVIGEAGVAFLLLLLALIVQGMLDALLKNKEYYCDWPALKAYILTNPGYSWLITGHVVILISIVIRFYMGSLRLHQEPDENNRGVFPFLLSVVSTLLLFSLLYVAAVFVKNIHVFYLALFAHETSSVIFTLGIIWHFKLLRGVWQRFLLFDVVSAIGLGSLVFYHEQEYAWKVGVLILLTIVGIIDVGWCWNFYKDDPNWEDWKTVSEFFEARRKQKADADAKREAEKSKEEAEKANRASQPPLAPNDPKVPPTSQ